jgi:hypothetical protein
MPEESTMSVEAVVNASLAGLQLGEIVCLPGLKDDKLLNDLNETQEAISQQVMTTDQPAARYIS